MSFMRDIPRQRQCLQICFNGTILTTLTVTVKMRWRPEHEGTAPCGSEAVASTLGIAPGGGGGDSGKCGAIEVAPKAGIVHHQLKIGGNWVNI